MHTIPFHRTWHAEREAAYMAMALAAAGAGAGFTPRCQDWLRTRTGALAVHLTHSCTAALEMAALLAGIGPGDEVIMPSFTFPSTANAFALRGGIPVFVDIRPDTLNLDETLIEAAITPRTKAIVPVHYAGVACEMDAIMEIATRHGLLVIEDAAQALGAMYKGRHLGTVGHLGAYSFHKTKNIQCLAGGALLINSGEFLARAEIIIEKGTDVRAFLRGDTSNYTWKDTGSAFSMSELHAALLLSQLEEKDALQEARQRLWSLYRQNLEPVEREGHLRLPPLTGHEHNAHIFYILLRDQEARDFLQSAMKEKGISLSTHYEPLHTSQAGRTLGRAAGRLPVTEEVARRLLRLPLFPGLSAGEAGSVTESLATALRARDAGTPSSHSPAMRHC